jgi:hypothetical protein
VRTPGNESGQSDKMEQRRRDDMKTHKILSSLSSSSANLILKKSVGCARTKVIGSKT